MCFARVDDLSLSGSDRVCGSPGREPAVAHAPAGDACARHIALGARRDAHAAPSGARAREARGGQKRTLGNRATSRCATVGRGLCQGILRADRTPERQEDERGRGRRRRRRRYELARARHAHGGRARSAGAPPPCGTAAAHLEGASFLYVTGYDDDDDEHTPKPLAVVRCVGPVGPPPPPGEDARRPNGEVRSASTPASSRRRRSARPAPARARSVPAAEQAPGHGPLALASPHWRARSASSSAPADEMRAGARRRWRRAASRCARSQCPYRGRSGPGTKPRPALPQVLRDRAPRQGARARGRAAAARRRALPARSPPPHTRMLADVLLLRDARA